MSAPLVLFSTSSRGYSLTALLFGRGLLDELFHGGGELGVILQRHLQLQGESCQLILIRRLLRELRGNGGRGGLAFEMMGDGVPQIGGRIGQGGGGASQNATAPTLAQFPIVTDDALAQVRSTRPRLPRSNDMPHSRLSFIDRCLY